jgi:hypothetical protein
MDVKVNILELASELADKELREKWDYRDGQIDIEDGQGGMMYSETAQEIFNLFYEDYYTIIDQIKR